MFYYQIMSFQLWKEMIWGFKQEESDEDAEAPEQGKKRAKLPAQKVQLAVQPKAPQKVAIAESIKPQRPKKVLNSSQVLEKPKLQTPLRGILLKKSLVAEGKPNPFQQADEQFTSINSSVLNKTGYFKKNFLQMCTHYLSTPEISSIIPRFSALLCAAYSGLGIRG